MRRLLPCARTANGVNYYCELEAMIMTNNNGGGLFDATKGLMAVPLESAGAVAR